MISYRRSDTGEIVSVFPGLGNAWIIGIRKPNGSVKRVKSPALPAHNSRECCQADLDYYAAAKGWQPVTKYGFSLEHDQALDRCRAERNTCLFGCTQDGAPNCYHNVNTGRCPYGH